MTTGVKKTGDARYAKVRRRFHSVDFFNPNFGFYGIPAMTRKEMDKQLCRMYKKIEDGTPTFRTI